MAVICISSIFEDLEDQRETAALAVRHLGHRAIAMEDYVASDERPLDKCLHDVRNSDVYVGIFAFRYGFIPGGYDKSITHLEYETAKKTSKTGYQALPSYISKYSPGDNYPVVGVSWDDANAYCNWLSEKTGLNFKLPTEAQWEKAARGTDKCKYPWVDSPPSGKKVNFADKQLFQKEKYSWADKNIDDGYVYTAPVGSYPQGASPFGLLDMAGNVWEWCYDWYGSYNPGSQSNPTGPDNGPGRVLRGGGWYSGAVVLRCAYRFYDRPSRRYSVLGFRLSQDN